LCQQVLAGVYHVIVKQRYRSIAKLCYECGFSKVMPINKAVDMFIEI